MLCQIVHLGREGPPQLLFERHAEQRARNAVPSKDEVVQLARKVRFSGTYTDRAAATELRFAGRKVCRERANEVVCISSVYFHVPQPNSVSEHSVSISVLRMLR